MEKSKEFIVFCQFCAVAKKIVTASSLEKAKKIAETDKPINIDEIIKLTKPCKVDEAILLKSNDQELDDHEFVEYKSWGAE